MAFGKSEITRRRDNAVFRPNDRVIVPKWTNQVTPNSFQKGKILEVFDFNEKSFNGPYAKILLENGNILIESIGYIDIDNQ